MNTTRREALARVIATRLIALTEAQLDEIDRKTTEMALETLEGQLDERQSR